MKKQVVDINQNAKKKTLIKIGIIAAVVILALIIFLLCFYLFKLQKNKEDYNATTTETNTEGEDSTK